MNFYSLSHVGQIRTNNEDYTEAFQFKWCGMDDKFHSFTALMLADGMGGAAAGEYASYTLIQAIKTEVQKKILSNEVEKFLYKDIRKYLSEVIQTANESIYKKAKSDPDYDGMGTTLVAAFIYQDFMTIAHIGDSRAYLLREGKFKQLTHDHSFVQELLDAGKITKEEAQNHPQKNIITRAVGVSPKIDVDFISLPLFVGDIVLLCSDGLSNYASESSIIKILKEKADSPFSNIPEICRELISLANANGGGDNISVCLYRHLAN